MVFVPPSAHWRRLFPDWFAPFVQTLRHAAQRHWAPIYLRGLCSSSVRKSMQPMAATVAPGKGDRFQHFITDSPWETAPLERLLAQRAQQLVGGDTAVLIIDDTCLTKHGPHAVGVARQYSGQVGKITPCQCLVSLTLARDERPVPLALRLYLGPEWTDDPDRCERAGVPEAHQQAKAKWEIALDELDRVRREVTFGVVLADAGYGTNARFRQALSRRGLLWSVGIVRNQTVYPEDVRLIPPPRIVRGRRPKHPSPSEDRQTVESLLDDAEWHDLVWRHGRKGALRGRFAARFVRLADGLDIGRGGHLPGEEVWIIGEWRKNGERKYYACNLPVTATLAQLVSITKKRWSCELAHRELKQDTGLAQFEGRSWRGLHHHAVLCMIALAFLQWVRLQRPPGIQGQTVPAVRAELAALRLSVVVCPCCQLINAQPTGP